MYSGPHATALASARSALPSLWPAFALCLSMAVANGLGRFAYALLLPAMREDLLWNYAQAGWLNTANALGYVLGAASAYALLHRVSARRLFQVGLGLCLFTLAATGASGALPWLSSQRALNGIGAAWVSACGSTLVLLHYRHAPTRRGAATGLFFGGAGIGIVAAGLAVAPLLALRGPSAWPQAWMALGAVGLLASLWPLRLAGQVQEAAATAEADRSGPLPLRHLGACLAAYFCWAGGYIIYLTFIFAWLREHGLSWQSGVAVWSVLGIAILGSGLLWRRALAHWPGAYTLSVCCAISLLGTLAPLLGSTSSLFISAAVFGSSVFIAAAAIAVLVRQNLPAARIGRAMALFNLAFAAGQAIGPVAAGAIADRIGLDGALWLSAALHLAAVLLPWTARAPRHAA
ncbi:YbfB/YjiJ family MFS transporter [Stenotrophomonas indicatrix]|uniref:YbfB/YjiJ family MFS transporter n=1 Tax=Stenotrophomonas indicatrix TaxID=2045451 RepID=A0ABT8QHJ6_9GAMM|nr:YbfB/YjiJ family MFS transporter [Stenotrophomonas indicatrix]MDN8662438.1 YbfB/YjiJ family MFS transporter [Stenotrophomonas indicatrix]MDN8670080.1 YbfB/YjiJ family MFS transporter [Stenotrophomonas indicatrix]PII12863.1 MFS transporter [Stenotrophomonas indicatrix]